MKITHLLLAFCCLTIVVAYTPHSEKTKKTDTERQIEAAGYVDIQEVNKTIKVSLMYAKADNFTQQVLYTDLHHAYLHPQAAAALDKAQRYLQSIRPDLSLIVFDAARPMHIQQRMWNVVKHTPQYFYVSNPARGGGLHNYGLAVDISLCTLNGDTLDMGTAVDFMGKESHIDQEATLVANRKISKRAQQNRLLLRKVMKYAGFKPLRTEWWHFNFKSRAEAKRYYKVIQ